MFKRYQMLSLLLVSFCVSFNSSAQAREVKSCQSYVQDCWKGQGCNTFYYLAEETKHIKWEEHGRYKDAARVAYETCRNAHESYSEGFCQRMCKFIEGPNRPNMTPENDQYCSGPC